MSEVTILIVDDESRMRKLIKDFLRQKNYNIMEAADGEEALKIYNENRDKINLILLDVMMPKLDGWSVLRQIRQDNKEVSIIFPHKVALIKNTIPIHCKKANGIDKYLVY